MVSVREINEVADAYFLPLLRLWLIAEVTDSISYWLQ